MSNFFRKIPQSLVVLVLVLAVFPGHAFAAEGDTSASAPDVADIPAADPVPDTPVVEPAPDTPTEEDTNWADVPAVDPTDLDGDDSDSSDSFVDAGGSYDYGYDYGGYDTFTASGADVTVNVQRHDTLSVASVSDGILDGLDSFSRSLDDTETPTLAETIRSLFGTYTPRTQTVTTYYDGQPISTEEQIVPGLAGLDYEWLAGVGMFALVTFCLFRLLGGNLKNG